MIGKKKSKTKDGKIKLGELPPDGYIPNLIPEGIYVGECIGLNTTNYHGHPKLCLYFRIFEEKYQKDFFVRFINFDYDPYPLGSDYYSAWVLASGKKPPSRKKASMPPQVFYRKVFKINVVTVTPKNKNGSDKSVHLHYSKVEQILELLPEPCKASPSGSSITSQPSTLNSLPVTLNQLNEDKYK